MINNIPHHLSPSFFVDGVGVGVGGD